MNSNNLNEFGNVFNESFQDLWLGLIDFLPKLIIALLLFVIGYLLGSLLAKAFEQVFQSFKIDKILSSAGVEDFFDKAGIPLNSGYFLGQIVKWFVIIVFLLPSLNLIGLETIADFLSQDVLSFLPSVIIASFILIAASFIGDALARFITVGAKSVNVKTAKMLGSIAKYSIWVFAFVIALGELGIAPAYMQILFTGFIAMISLGGALAFGFGGKEEASNLLKSIREDFSNKK